MRRIKADQVMKAVEILGDYCRQHDSCSVCRLADVLNNCKLAADLPCYWVVRTRPDGGDPDEDIR